MRYLRVNKLIPPLKELLDAGTLGVYSAVSLSYLKENEQELLCGMISNITLGIRQAEALRLEAVEHELTKQSIEKILNPEKTVKSKPFKLRRRLIDELFSNGESEEDIAETVEKALRTYLKKW
jgi:ParB family chromosome partitioning protein